MKQVKQNTPIVNIMYLPIYIYIFYTYVAMQRIQYVIILYSGHYFRCNLCAYSRMEMVYNS